MSDSTGMTVNQLIDALSKISKEHGDRTVAIYDEGWKGISEIHLPVDDLSNSPINCICGDKNCSVLDYDAWFYLTFETTIDELFVWE